MSQIRLVLADGDTMFLEKFSTYLLNSKSPTFALDLFSNRVNLEEWLKTGEMVDIIVVSMSLYNELTNKPDKKNLVILSDCPESMLPEGITSIYKYRPASLIIKEILSLSAERFPKEIVREKEMSNINLVLYADGSDVLNPFAQSLACIKADCGNKTLYLSLDEISNTDAYFFGNNSRGLSEMLYYVKSNKANLSLKAEACISYDMSSGVNFFKGHNNPSDITNLSETELDALINSINSKAGYDQIVITRGFSNDKLMSALIKTAHKIYIIAFNYLSSLTRVKNISSYFTEFENENNIILNDKIEFIITNFLCEQEFWNEKNTNYDLKYLSSPLKDNGSVYPPAEKYLSELKALS